MTFHSTHRPVQLKLSLNPQCKQEGTGISDLSARITGLSLHSWFLQCWTLCILAGTILAVSRRFYIYIKDWFWCARSTYHGRSAGFDMGIDDTHPFPCFRFLEALMLYEGSCGRDLGRWYTVCIQHIHSSLQSHFYVCIPRQTVRRHGENASHAVLVAQVT